MATVGKATYWARAGENSCRAYVGGDAGPDPKLKCVRLSSPPPDQFHVCIDNGDGTGIWRPARWYFFKRTAYRLGLSVQRLREWVLGGGARLARPLLVRWVNLDGWCEFVFKRNTLFVFLFPSSYRKCMSYIMLSLIFFIPAEFSGVVASVGMSVVAAAIFDIVVNIAPDEFRKLRYAKRISELVGKMSLIKVEFLVAIGCIDDPWDSTSTKGVKVSSVSREIFDSVLKFFSTDAYLNFKYARLLNRHVDCNISIYINRIMSEYVKCLEELMGYCFVGYFPSFYDTLIDIDSLRRNGNISFDFTIGDFIGIGENELRSMRVLSLLFKVVYLVDVLEYSCEMHVFPYSKTRFGYSGCRTFFSERFVGHQHLHFGEDVFRSVVEAQSGR